MIDRSAIRSRCARKALIALFLVSGTFSALADGESFTFPKNPATDKYTARLHDGTKTNTVTWGNKVKLTVLQGKVFAVTANEMIVARRTIKFKIEPITLEGWHTSTDPYEETRDLRNNNNGNVFNNFNGVAFIEEHADPDDGMMNGWEWMMPYVRVADMQVDSLNQNPYGGVSGSDEEDAKEDTDQGGKILACNVLSYTPGKPGWADFSGAPGSHPSFAKMVLFLQGFPTGTQVRFQYSASDPSAISQDNEGWHLPQNGGCLRVWTKNVYQNRNINNDYIQPNTAYTLADLQAKHAQVADGHFVFYVEAVKTITSVADSQVTVEVQAPNSSWATLDTVRFAPLALTQENMPNFGAAPNTTDTGSSYDIAAINGGGVAYITGEPAMPHLKAEAKGAPANASIQWKLEIKTERTAERGTKDDKNYPASGYKTLSANQAWDIGAEFGSDFVGGKCKLVYMINNGPEQTLEFFIRGKNPKDEDAKSHIQAQGQFWYAWPIAKHESRQGNQIYNQFNSGGDGPGNLELPNFGPPNGWGAFQRDDTDGGIYVDTKQVYSWHGNTTVGFTELNQKNNNANQYINSVQQQYPNQFVEPPLFDVSAPVGANGFPVAAAPSDGHTVTGREGLAITLYNGGYYSWLKFISNEPDVTKRWQFKPNNAPSASEPYVTKIMEEYRGN